MSYPEIETPAVLIDTEIAEANIRRFQEYCDQHGLNVRPHIKTHKIPELAKQQLAAGAVGINCQKIGEAEVMADTGLDDILITYNILGEAKLQRLRAVADRVSSLAVTADSDVVVDGLSRAFSDTARPLKVLVECDTGGRRCGVQSPREAFALAQRVANLPGLHFNGLMTYPAPGSAEAVQTFVTETIGLLGEADLECPVVSVGGTPDMWRAHLVPAATEHRPGTYIYYDRSMVARSTCTEADCAITVLVTVVSTPAAGRAVIDAGSKVLSSDLLGLDGHGHIIGRPDIAIAKLSEEHGHLDYPADAEPLTVGERLRIIPNHACVVSNLVDAVHFTRQG
ncbi:MAG TPA: D-TA family PLP-dependent enzyme, partial [Afifellaceae bacterium]|nr:D-TA family PLP-dependent enzyme [Afifellaceae bacterium]